MNFKKSIYSIVLNNIIHLENAADMFSLNFKVMEKEIKECIRTSARPIVQN